MHQRIWIAAVAGALLLGPAGGCGGGGDGLPRVAASGTVTLDGQPLEEGAITLVPQGSGPTVGGDIRSGRFSIPKADGPIPGTYRVEIRASKATGRKVPDRDGEAGAVMDEVVSLVPGRYNLRSTLTAEVKAGGPNTFEFPLDGQPDKPAPKARR